MYFSHPIIIIYIILSIMFNDKLNNNNLIQIKFLLKKFQNYQIEWISFFFHFTALKKYMPSPDMWPSPEALGTACFVHIIINTHVFTKKYSSVGIHHCSNFTINCYSKSFGTVTLLNKLWRFIMMENTLSPFDFDYFRNRCKCGSNIIHVNGVM